MMLNEKAGDELFDVKMETPPVTLAPVVGRYWMAKEAVVAGRTGKDEIVKDVPVKDTLVI